MRFHEPSVFLYRIKEVPMRGAIERSLCGILAAHFLKGLESSYDPAASPQITLEPECDMALCDGVFEILRVKMAQTMNALDRLKDGHCTGML